MLITQNGETEEEEKAPDYLAMHAYPNLKGASKVLEDRNALVKSVYTNEQNYMLYLELPAAEYMNQMKVLNLVLDQHQRKKDLFYNIRVLSSCQFSTERAAFKQLKYVQKLSIPENVKGGGTPAAPTFFNNPQVYFNFDKTKVQNPGSIEKIEVLITYTSDKGADVKLFLLNADSKDRVCSISEAKLVDASLKTSYYQPVTVHLHYKLNASDFYTVVASTFKSD